MAHLIDKDALEAKIRERLLPVVVLQGVSYDDWKCGAHNERLRILDLIDTLEVKEVDLDKEIEDYAYSLPHSANGTSSYVSDTKSPKAREFGIRHYWSYDDVELIAEHFFELGIKAQKGK